MIDFLSSKSVDKIFVVFSCLDMISPISKIIISFRINFFFIGRSNSKICNFRSLNIKNFSIFCSIFENILKIHFKYRLHLVNLKKYFG